MIIETTDNRFFEVRTNGTYDHVYEGVEVKKVRGTFVAKKNARRTLVRKLASRIVTGA